MGGQTADIACYKSACLPSSRLHSPQWQSWGHAQVLVIIQNSYPAAGILAPKEGLQLRSDCVGLLKQHVI